MLHKLCFFLLSVCLARDWEDILKADISCCNPISDADLCSETVGGAGCIWLEYGISEDVNNIILQSGSQCVGYEYYKCRMETEECCAPGCASPTASTDSPGPSPSTPSPTSPVCSRGEPMPNCVLGLNYAFEGVPCQISMDPHSKKWNGGKHDFQGQPDVLTADGSKKNQFYYISSCSDMSSVDLPFSVLGTHLKFREAQVSGLDYLVIELFDKLRESTPSYNLYLSSSISSFAATSSNGVSTDYDDTKRDAPASLVEIEGDGSSTKIGERFQVKVTMDDEENTMDFRMTIDAKYNVSIFMKAQMTPQTGESGDTRYTMHYALINQHSAFKCSSCGLCGDFKHEMDVGLDFLDLLQKHWPQKTLIFVLCRDRRSTKSSSAATDRWWRTVPAMARTSPKRTTPTAGAGRSTLF